jgi:PTH1 family peptidyl-tRNA hydrolase
LRDIIAHLNSNDFYRLRIGIDRPGSSHQVANYVLSAPNKFESENLFKAFDDVNPYLEQVVLGDIAKAMNGLNAKN